MSGSVEPDEAEIVTIGEGFLARTFPGDRLHHREHLIATTYLLSRFPSRNWRRDLPDLIRGYNVAQGGVNDEARGYHHTITMAYLTLVEQVLAQVGRDDLASACAAVLTSPAADGQALLRFYSRGRLFSREARIGWLDPDLAGISLSEFTPDRR